jgi:hypothetical protein
MVMAEVNHEFISEDVVTINHNLNTDVVAIDVMLSGFGGEREKTIPDGLEIVNENTVIVEFLSPQSGTVRLIAVENLV